MAVGGWRLAVGVWWGLGIGGLAVGGGKRLAVGGGWWRLVVGGWWSLGAALNKKKRLLKNSPDRASAGPLLKDTPRPGPPGEGGEGLGAPPPPPHQKNRLIEGARNRRPRCGTQTCAVASAPLAPRSDRRVGGRARARARQPMRRRHIVGRDTTGGSPPLPLRKGRVPRDCAGPRGDARTPTGQRCAGATQPPLPEARGTIGRGGGGAATEHYPALARRRLSATRRRLSVTRRRLSVTRRRMSVTRRRLSVTRRRLSVTRRRLSANRRRLGVTRRRLSVSRRRLSVTRRWLECHPPSVECHPPSVECHPP